MSEQTLDYQMITPKGMRDADGSENLEGLHPVVLVGTDGSPYRFARMFDRPLPTSEGWLSGVQAVWGAWMSQAGTLGVTLVPRSDNGVAARTVWLDDEQLAWLQDGMSDYELRALQGCEWISQGGNLRLEAPQVFNCFAPPLNVEGEIAVVSSVVHTASADRTLTAAEALVWLADYALSQGFSYTSPELLSDPDNCQGVREMLSGLEYS